MSAMCPSGSHRYGTRTDPLDLECVQGCCDSDDVGNGVERADLVEMNLIKLSMMDFCLSLGQPPKACQRPIADRGWEVSGFDELGDRTPFSYRNILSDHLDGQAVRVLPGTGHRLAAQPD
jgi:hypothetical protein